MNTPMNTPVTPSRAHAQLLAMCTLVLLASCSTRGTASGKGNINPPKAMVRGDLRTLTSKLRALTRSRMPPRRMRWP